MFNRMKFNDEELLPEQLRRDLVAMNPIRTARTGYMEGNKCSGK